MGIKLSQRILGIEESQTLAFEQKARELIHSGIDVVSLSAGEPDFPTVGPAREAAIAAVEAGKTKYTDVAGTLELRQAICDKLQQDNGLAYLPKNIIVCVGAKQALYNICQVLLEKGDEAIISAPYWATYTEQVKLAEAQPVIAPTEGFQVTARNIASKVTKKTKLIILNSPCNPTGAVIEKKELVKIADLAVEKGIMLISDEIYEKITYGKEHFSIASFNDNVKEHTITVNGVSKAYSMTGWRIGYAAGPEEIIKAMVKLQGQVTSNPSSIYQAAALYALKQGQSDSEKMAQEFRKRRDYAMQRLSKIKGMRCKVPDGAFYAFPDISGIEQDSRKFALQLLEKAHVSVVPGAGFGSEGYLRISYATSMKKLAEGMDRLESFIKCQNFPSSL